MLSFRPASFLTSALLLLAGCTAGGPQPKRPASRPAAAPQAFHFDWTKDGAALLPAAGTWRRAPDGTWLQEETGRFDLCCFAPEPLTGRYRLSVEIRHEEGGFGGGLIFHARSRAAPGDAEMVRFESARTMLQGRFENGAFHCDRVLELPAPIARGRWVELALEIDAARGRLAVFVAGRAVARGLRLRYRGGYAGLEASEGKVRFRAFRAAGLRSPDPGPIWPERAWLGRDGALRVFSPLFGLVHRYDAEARTFRPAAGGRPPARPRPSPDLARRLPGLRAALRAGSRIYAALAGEVRILDLAGRTLGRLRAADLGGIDPVDLVARGGLVYALDRRAARFVEVPPGGDPRLAVEFPQPGRLELRLSSGGRVLYRTSRVGLEPETRLHFDVPLLPRTLPPGPGTRALSILTPPAPGLLRARRLKLLALVYGNVFDTAPKGAPAPYRPWPRSEYERIHEELARTVRWYWIQSRFHLLLELTIVDIEDPVAAGDLSETGRPNGKPKEAELAGRARAAGLDLKDFQGVLVLMAYRKPEAKSGRLQMVGHGGALTLGAHGRGYGISWWFIPEKRDYNSWLFCHEFHHQLDALFELSGHPEYWFNHFAPLLGTDGPFGEHWDGNAWILRSWPAPYWDDLKFGDRILCADADRDGIPDGDPRVPFDESRFGSDPSKIDTDGDGLDDYAELFTSPWLLESGFEMLAGPAAAPNPREFDSDGDGLPDARDPLPLHPGSTDLPAEGLRLLGTISHPDLGGDVAVRIGLDRGRRPPALVLEAGGVAPEDHLELRALLDLSGDGWFTGRDNVELRVHDGGAGVEVRVQNAAVAGRWPFFDEELAGRIAPAIERRKDGFTVRVPLVPELGVRPAAPARFGLDVMVSSARSRGFGRSWLALYYPHVLLPCRWPQPAGGD